MPFPLKTCASYPAPRNKALTSLKIPFPVPPLTRPGPPFLLSPCKALMFLNCPAPELPASYYGTPLLCTKTLSCLLPEAPL